ncbi:hypothetical protein BCR34DRAFT_626345 [Clohesyomyces aquaticus]|uniref:P-loop containing nucleoside triphosphate hydrolase protein n=1 Tax=Clohesyomyces aquaticus TaxID=1231657 RepID=A0A1Y1ZCG6_9PLEO|nr:hypothetical protein BCR34DRAFT_626345 [Clohesyomyces aquaticus]
MRPRPSLFILFRRDGDFVNRASLLEQIDKRCSLPASRVALVGLGGAEYCYRVAERSPGTWVFWAYASNTARLQQSFQEMADHLKMPGRQNEQADVFNLVHDWLRSESHGPWLLVLDNADDPGILSPPQDGRGATQKKGESSTLQKNLCRYLPECRHRSLLVTSRTNRAAVELVEKSDIIPIESMDQQLAYDLLQNKLGGEGDSNNTEIGELGSTLDYMPLALAQAATYIRRRAPRYSVKQYLEDCRTDESKRTFLLIHDVSQLRRAFQMSFEHVRNTYRSTADLLSLMSFFDQQGIPADLLQNREETADELVEASAEDPAEDTTEGGGLNVTSVSDDFEDDILVLKDYSFISETTENTFEMHRLVPLAMLEWLGSQGQLNHWREQYICRLYAEFPENPQYEDWGECRALYPHSDESLKDWAQLLCDAEWYGNDQGQAGEAEEIRKSILGEENSDPIESICALAAAKWLHGRYIESEKLYLQGLEGREKELGERHPHTRSIMNDLASTYGNQDRWKEAEQLQLHVLDARKKELSERHPDTLLCINNLATTYGKQG